MIRRWKTPEAVAAKREELAEKEANRIVREALIAKGDIRADQLPEKSRPLQRRP